MVEINNQRGRSSICWRGRRESITDVRKPEINGYDVIVGGELFTGLPDHPSQTCHAKNSKLKSTGVGRYQLLSCWWDAYRKQLGLKDFSGKVRRCSIAAD